MKEEILSYYQEVVESICNNYQKESDKANLIIDSIIKDLLIQIDKDSKTLPFKEFYQKYKLNSFVFEYKDFTASDIRIIISETPLTERDRMIAVLRYVDLKSEEEIAYELQIDKKTVHNNLPKISVALKNTCMKLYH